MNRHNWFEIMKLAMAVAAAGFLWQQVTLLRQARPAERAVDGRVIANRGMETYMHVLRPATLR